MENDNWEIWKEEYDEICKLELERGKADKEIARRLLIFTEGFMYKILSTDTDKLSPKSLKILNEIREKNKLMIPKNMKEENA